MEATVVSEAAPVRAWRYWQLSARGLLRSVSQRHVVWAADRALHATCLGGGHPAPDARCNCGISGARDLDTLRNYGLCVACGPLMVGEVDLWGRIVPDSYGYRGEYGKPASIGLVGESVSGDVERDQVVASLEAYGVPVIVVALDEAVAGVTATTLAFQMMSAKASGTLE